MEERKVERDWLAARGLGIREREGGAGEQGCLGEWRWVSGEARTMRLSRGGPCYQSQ